MALTLVYRGDLPAASGSNKRTQEKHEIRRHFHKQILNVPKAPYSQMVYGASEYGPHWVGNFKFHPLICRDENNPKIGCELSIEALSHDPFGAVIQSGDLDNRLKTLFDALCIPNEDQVQNEIPGDTETPFWVLLSDDRLITDFHFTQNILHTPRTNHNSSYIELTIKVSVKTADIA